MIDNEILACPRCDRGPLTPSESGFACDGCKTEFPDFAGLPWLFAEPNAALAEWQGRWGLALRGLEQSDARFGRALASTSLRRQTRDRLEHMQTATREHRERLEELLTPLKTRELTAEFATYLALRTRPPTEQGLFSYYPNIHRDWNWGDEENRKSLEIVRDALGERTARKLLVLGAGPGRLAYDLHAALPTELTIAVDFNPFLSLIGQRICRGETLTLHEFPISPKTIQDQAVLRDLSAPAAARDGLEFVVADCHRPPFAHKAFDVVVTPWLIDILPEPLEDFTKRINSLLADGGTWVNIGSLNFQSGSLETRHGLDECLAVLEENGFEAATVTEHEIPYMCSPASRHGRREQIVCWSAPRAQPVKKVPRYEALPDWIVRGTTPIPRNDALDTQAMSARVHAYILSLIDGKRTLKDIAKALAAQNVMAEGEAEASIRTFLVRLHDEQRRMG